MRDAVLVLPVVLLLALPLVTGSEDEGLSPPEKSSGFFGIIRDIISNPGKYIEYIKLVIEIFLDYLQRIKGYAHQKKNKLVTGLGRKGNYGAAHETQEGKIDPEVERQINAIVDSITAHLADVLPAEAPLPPKDYDYKAVFACATKGRLYNLKTILRSRTIIVPHNDKDSIDIHLSFYIADMHVKYDKLVTRTSALRVRNGQLSLEFEENEIKVHLFIPSISTFLSRAFNMQCIIEVINVKVDKLEGEHVHVRTDGIFRGHITKLFIKGGMRMMMSSVLQNVNDSIYEAIMDNLDTSGWWICRKKRTQPEIPDIPWSESFKRYCMEDEKGAMEDEQEY